MKVRTATLPSKGKTTTIKPETKCLIVDKDVKLEKMNFGPNPGDNVNHPPHYKGKKFEVIDIIEDFELDFREGNALKYLLRAGKKHSGCDGYCEDLEKAIWYLQRAVQESEKTHGRR